eukprot:CAMPEP_0114638680 /NCGR_PEP_ID=MMETSP0191-20121206/752_1 /TAXON_ID=126664 /ORGANISM="Sorites sp." /LENGTH=130 /DNA_ID=CAMNT_0001850469 /DNA_START=366 /DNA_END=758 /DNA_ORIENTATION=-
MTILNTDDADANGPQSTESTVSSISTAENEPVEMSPMSCDKVIAVHQFMLKEIRKFVDDFKSSPGVFYDFATARLCTGLATWIKLEEEFQLSKADLDRAMVQHYRRLKWKRDFRRITDEINDLLTEFDEP